ncbi:putative inorganic phosphate cotransporter [Hyposmocoma kahamanoa]|uniref:putative inorganic phosphate cotransporter n=1 Tax=Hyposmocoma kahamanoa TaxID=1477025 RepID=UPI000E6D836C|nr:putative inorganic phosphate cotransporter [Hyposmocoma kahamanoa]
MGANNSKPKRLSYIMPDPEPEEEIDEELSSDPAVNFNQPTVNKFLDEMRKEIRSQFGTVLAFPLSGLLAGSPALGWPTTFWLWGVVSFICLGLLAWLGAASPYDHPSLRAEEFTYIMSDGNADAVPKKRKVPWRHILKSKPMWGVIVSHAGSAMAYLFVLMQIPIYMSKVLGVGIKKNGVYSSLPYIAMYFSALLFGYLADMCVTKNIMSIANVRRVANTIGMVVSGAFLVGFCFVNSMLPAVIVLVLCLGLHSGVHVGFHINTLDLAPNFSGILMSIGNMIANLSSLLVPVMISNVVGDDTGNQHKWQIMFIVIASIQVIANVVFVIFVKGDVQPWNFYGDDDNGENLNSHKKKSVVI